MEKKIEKPWAVYSYGLRPSGLGLITREVEGGSLFIMDYGNSSPECWDPRYVERFHNPEEAASYYLKSIRLPHKLKEVLYRFSRSFPEEFEKLRPDRIKNLCSVLLTYRDSLLAQISPKCTEEQKHKQLISDLASEGYVGVANLLNH